MWNDGSYKIMNILYNVENTGFPTKCPVCGKDDRNGGVRTWCSECRIILKTIK